LEDLDGLQHAGVVQLQQHLGRPKQQLGLGVVGLNAAHKVRLAGAQQVHQLVQLLFEL
jgi:hypothetical protein